MNRSAQMKIERVMDAWIRDPFVAADEAPIERAEQSDTGLVYCRHCAQAIEHHPQRLDYEACMKTLGQLIELVLINKEYLVAFKNTKNGFALHIPEVDPFCHGEGGYENGCFKSSLHLVTSEQETERMALEKASSLGFSEGHWNWCRQKPWDPNNYYEIEKGRGCKTMQFTSNQWIKLREMVNFLLPLYPPETTFLRLSSDAWTEQCNRADTWL